MREFVYNLVINSHPIIGITCALLYLFIPAIAVFGAAIGLQKLIDEIKYKFFE